MTAIDKTVPQKAVTVEKWQLTVERIDIVSSIDTIITTMSS